MNIVEIGANNGSNTTDFLQNSNLWIFEPNPKYVNILNDKFENNDNVKIFQKAVSNFDGNAVFNISSDGVSSSLNKLSKFSIDNNLIKFDSSIIVDVIRMDTFLIENNIDIINYLHCDAQGNDLRILESFGDRIHSIERGMVEVSLRDELYDDVINDFKNTIIFLENNGFVIENLLELKNTKWYDGNLKFHKKKLLNII